MRSYDLSPLFRSTVGFDRMTRLLESALNGEDNSQNAYPPYNIEKLGDDQYRITMAVAGFSQADLEIIAHPNLLGRTGQGQGTSGRHVPASWHCRPCLRTAVSVGGPYPRQQCVAGKRPAACRTGARGTGSHEAPLHSDQQPAPVSPAGHDPGRCLRVLPVQRTGLQNKKRAATMAALCFLPVSLKPHPLNSAERANRPYVRDGGGSTGRSAARGSP